MFSEIRLGDVITLQRGFDITKAEQSPGHVPIVSSSGISSFHNQIKVEGPGVIIGRKGTLGTVHFLVKDYWPHDTTLWVKDFKGNVPQFVAYFLRTLKLENFDTGASNPTLNRNHVHKIKVLFPTSHETQRKIAATLTAYDELIVNNEHRIDSLEKIVEELYREWFVRMRFPGHESTEFVRGVPTSWKTTKLTKLDYASLISPNLESFDDTKDYFATSAVAGTNLGAPTEEIFYASKPSRAQFSPTPYSVWFARMKNTFKVLVINDSNKKLCDRAVLSSGFIGMSATKESYPFIYCLIKSTTFHEIKDLYCTGATQESLTNNGLKRIEVLAPTKKLVYGFSEKVGPLMEEIVTLKLQNDIGRQARDLLLPRLISGKLSLENLDIHFPPSMRKEA